MSSAMLCLRFRLELDDLMSCLGFDSGTGGGSIAAEGLGECDEDNFAIVGEERRPILICQRRARVYCENMH